MELDAFQKLANAGYNRVPVYREVLADLETPLSCYLKLAQGPYSFLFESLQGGETWGRYSIIGLPCHHIIQIRDEQITVKKNGKIIDEKNATDPLAWLDDYIKQFNYPDIDELPRFNGGLVGYFGYDTVRYIEPRLGKCPNKDDLNIPDIVLMVVDELLIFDNLNASLHIIVQCDPQINDAWEQAQQRLDAIEAQLQKPIKDNASFSPNRTKLSLQSNVSKEAFMASVEKSKEYIKAGDLMQVVYSQRFSTEFHASPLQLYRALRRLNPSPYLYFLDLADFHIVGASPEILVRVKDEIVTLRPLAGTRKRGETEEEDVALAEELLADPKELAEHLMLIDLGRNDVGRVCDIGSVKVTEKMVIERYSHVMHIVSNVHGKLKPDCSAIDALRAAFPAGTLSGAPKIRAMEIIDELENTKRGIYGGAVGYLSWQGEIDLAITIRTALIKDNTLYTQAGAGLVYDSVPELEWEESVHKAKAICQAAEMVNNEF